MYIPSYNWCRYILFLWTYLAPSLFNSTPLLASMIRFPYEIILTDLLSKYLLYLRTVIENSIKIMFCFIITFDCNCSFNSLEICRNTCNCSWSFQTVYYKVCIDIGYIINIRSGLFYVNFLILFFWFYNNVPFVTLIWRIAFILLFYTRPLVICMGGGVPPAELPHAAKLKTAVNASAATVPFRKVFKIIKLPLCWLL